MGTQDYVEMQWLMLQQENQKISLFLQEEWKQFEDLLNSAKSLDGGIVMTSLQVEGEGINEIGRRGDTYEIVVKIDPRYFRPTEVDKL